MILFPRCNVFPSPQAFLLILLYVLPLIAADPTALDKLYNLRKAGSPGSCATQLSDLKTAYTEGLAMTQAAINAIDAIKNGKSTNWIPTSNNNRKAKMLQAMFNIRASGLLKSISSGDSAALDTVRGVYQKTIDDANIDFQGLFWLYCGDNYFNYYNPTDKDPSYIGSQDPPPTLGTNQPRLNQFGGWWDGEISWFKSQKANEQRSDVFCSATTGAFTIRAFQSITWCPNSFSGFSNNHKYLTSIGGIQANQKQINKDDQLKSYESLASVWLHEWTHLQSSTADQPAVDGKGNSIAGKSYGFYGCANLARKKPDGQTLAIANADTFAYFAMAMYLDKWDWSSGIAANSLGL